MRLHEPPGVPANVVRTREQLRMDQVERADVEAGRRADSAAEGDHPLDEVEAGAADIEAAVDMGGLDVEKAFRADRFGKPDEEPHGEGSGAAVDPGQKLAVEVGERQSHPGRIAAACPAGQTGGQRA